MNLQEILNQMDAIEKANSALLDINLITSNEQGIYRIQIDAGEIIRSLIQRLKEAEDTLIQCIDTCETKTAVEIIQAYFEKYKGEEK